MRAAIIKAASELFFENGFSKTTSGEVCKKADVGTGNLTFYFPTKEHILAVLVHMMCDFQWREMQSLTNEGKSSLLAYCLELTTMISVSDDIPEMQDLFIAAYSHPMTLDIIRENDAKKLKRVFENYTEGWSDERFTELEAIISGIEYASFVNTEHSVSAAHRIEGALNAIMLLFGVPEEIRKVKIEKVLKMNYAEIGRKIYRSFKDYVTETNEQALEEVLRNTKIRTYR